MVRTMLRRRATSAAVTLFVSVALPVVLATPAHAVFTQCPAIGGDTGCGALITINPGSPPTATITFDATQPPYDGADDTLVGVQNNAGVSTAALQITCTSCTNPIFGFDGDGICSGAFTGTPAGCPFGPTGYEGPNTSFANYCAPSCNTGTVVVDFGTGGGCGATPGTSAYFSLEDSLSSASVITVTVLTPRAEAMGIVPGPVVHAGPVSGPSGSATDQLAHQVVGPVTVDAVRAHAQATYTSADAEAYIGKVTVSLPGNTVVVSALDVNEHAVCKGSSAFFSGQGTTADVTVNGVSQGGVTGALVVNVPQCGPGGGIGFNQERPIFGGTGRQLTGLTVYCPIAGVQLDVSVARVWFA